MAGPLEAVREEGERGGILHNLLDAMADPVCVVDGEGTILYANRAMASLCGEADPQKIAGKPAGVALGPLPPRAREALFGALREKTRVRFAANWERGGHDPAVLDGEAFFFLLPGEGSFPAAALAARVVPEKVPGRQTAAIAASRRKAKELLSVVRHDILNQLTILIGFLQFSEDFIEDPKVREFVAKEETAGENIQVLIEFTRDFQEIITEDPRWIMVPAAIGSATGILDPGSVDIRVDVGPVEVFASPLLGYVFQTLVGNTIDHATGFSHITITGGSDGDDLLLTVEDDGPGIPEAERKMLFERGHGRNRGYGLWLSKEILAIGGAAIRETGEPGRGARFEIRVPGHMWRRQA